MRKFTNPLFLSASVFALALLTNGVDASAENQQKKRHDASTPATHAAKRSRVFGAHQNDHGSASAGHGQVANRAGHSEPAATRPGHAAAKSGHAPAQPGHAAAKSGHAAHWGYSGPAGPSHWAGLKGEYRACGAGKMQSPIDVTKGLQAKPSEITFNYKVSPLTLVNNGHTVQANYKKGSGILVDGRRFELLQFHFHAPSEHAIDGKRYPMEMHLVHKDASGALAVVGVMLDTGVPNLALEEIWGHLPKQKSAPAHVKGVAINARDLLPADVRYHHYKGSLTTPPCSEGVNWFVLAKPVQIGARQIMKFAKIVGDNARPLQSKNNRLLISAR
ncbi:MAG: carbonic anhydrase [Methyloligellaceae bacterium]